MADVPVDFPCGCAAPTVPAAQPKFMARKIDGRYVVGLTAFELHERWVYCEDLAQKLAERTGRKQVAGLVSDLDVFYRETKHRVRGQGWDLSNDEVIRLMKRTRALGGCAEFCVNGQSTAGAGLQVRKHNDNQEARSIRRTAGQPAGRLQET